MELNRSELLHSHLARRDIMPENPIVMTIGLDLDGNVGTGEG